MEEYKPYIIRGKNLPAKVHYWKLSDSGEGFNISVYALENNDLVVDILFDHALAHRSIDEGDHLKLWENFELSTESFIYTVENSEFLKYFNEESYNIHDTENIKHFFIVTSDDCIDVIASGEPKISTSMTP